MFQWSEEIAVGNLSFVEKLKSELGFKAAHRDSAWFKPYWQIKIARAGDRCPV